MHRRARHLNPGSAGAVLALDSRFITGLSDGDPVSTWTDRTNNALNATSSGSARPIYKINQQNGNPVVRYNNTANLRTASINLAGTYGFTNTSTIIISAKNNKADNTVRGMLIYTLPGSDALQYYFAFFDNKAYYDHGDTSGPGRVSGTVANSNNANINSANGNGTTGEIIRNGLILVSGSQSDNLPSSANHIGIGCGSNGSTGIWDGDFYSFIIASWYSPPLRRRLEHAAAFAFKIPCS